MKIFKKKRDVHVSPNILKFINLIDDFYQEQQKKLPMERDICPPGTDPQLVVNCLCDVFLGEDWYVALPVNQKQANTVILDNILYKYYPAYNKYKKE